MKIWPPNQAIAWKLPPNWIYTDHNGKGPKLRPWTRFALTPAQRFRVACLMWMRHYATPEQRAQFVTSLRQGDGQDGEHPPREGEPWQPQPPASPPSPRP